MLLLSSCYQNQATDKLKFSVREIYSTPITPGQGFECTESIQECGKMWPKSQIPWNRHFYLYIHCLELYLTHKEYSGYTWWMTVPDTVNHVPAFIHFIKHTPNRIKLTKIWKRGWWSVHFNLLRHETFNSSQTEIHRYRLSHSELLVIIWAKATVVALKM